MVSTITDRVGAVAAGLPVQRFGFGIITLVDVAGTNTITANTEPEISSYVENQVYIFRPVNANTGAVNVDLEGLGNRALKAPGGAALAGAELSTSQDYLFKDNGSEFRLITPF